MSVYSNIHFCLFDAAKPAVSADVHRSLADTIDVTMRIGDASVTVSGKSADVRNVLAEMVARAERVVPLTESEAAAARSAP